MWDDSWGSPRRCELQLLFYIYKPGMNLASLCAAFIAGCAVTWSSTFFVKKPSSDEAVNAANLAETPFPVRSGATPLATPFARPADSLEISAHEAALAAIFNHQKATTGNTCEFPPSKIPDRKTSVPVTNAFGTTLNLESVMRPWSKGSPPTTSFGPEGVAELSREPNASAFLQYFVHLSQPFIIRGYAQQAAFPALELWTDEYLSRRSGSTPLHVRQSHFGDDFFHYAHRWSDHVQMTMAAFIATFDGGESVTADGVVGKARFYMGQTELLGRRNPGTLSQLLPDAPPPHFARTLDLKHISLWFGSGTIHNPAHYDANENLLVMLSGEKTFTLFPPGARNFMYPVMQGEYSAPMTRPVDVSRVNLTTYPCFAHALAMSTEVTLRAGDLLYLPPYWWHQGAVLNARVSRGHSEAASCGIYYETFRPIALPSFAVVTSRGRSLAVNYWYSVHSALLQQIMKAIDHSMLIEDDQDDYTRPFRRRQRVW